MAALPDTEVYYRGVLVATLDAGETFFVDGANDRAGGGGVDSGDTITASGPIQIQMMTGSCGVRYSALVPNLRGAERALDAGFTELEVVVSASDTHNRKNVNRSTEESLDDIAKIIDLAHGRGATCQVIVSTAWGCPYEGDVPVERVVGAATRAVRDGADSASFGDTTGMATPSRVTTLVG